LIKTVGDLDVIKGWFPGKQLQLTLLYRGSKDGFGASTFHTKVNNQGATLILASSATYNRIFGGYVAKSWASVSNYVQDTDAFLFSHTEKQKVG